MKYLSLLALAVAGLVALLLLRTPPPSAAEVDLDSAVERTEASTIALDRIDTEVTPTDASRIEATVVADEGQDDGATPEYTGPTARVAGRIVDQDGAPLRARAQIMGFPWPADAPASPLPRLGNETYTRVLDGVEGETDEDGRFVIEVPYAEASRYSIRAVADPYHDSIRLFFGRDGVTPLLEGDTDLGEIRLAVTGAIRGTVTDSRGAPIANAELDTGPGRSTTYSRGSLSREDGSFLIPHAPVGSYLAKAEAEGYLSVQQDVTVEAGVTAGPVDFVLADAPRIEARVVDEAGQPIENVRFWGWPESSGSGAGGRSAADGSVIIYLPQAERYTMEATHPDHEKWGDDDRSVLYEPGTSLGTITMRSKSKVRFIVVDEANDEPLDAFGLRVLSGEGSASESGSYTAWRHPRVKPYPDRHVDLAAKPEFDAYLAYAPGFLQKEGDVAPAEAGEGPREQRIVLSRGAGIRGRLTWNEASVPGARIEIVPDTGYSKGAFRPEERFAFTVSTDVDGRFETTGLRAGRAHRITATRAGSPVPLVRILDPLGTKEIHDLGDLPFLEGGSIAGTVVLPEGIDPGGLTVYLGDWREDRNAVTDSSGAFLFENVPPGEHTMGQRGRPDVVESGGSLSATVESGATTEMVFDLTSLAMMSIEIEVSLGGNLAAGVEVELLGGKETITGADFEIIDRDRIRLGETDADGVVHARGRAMADAQVGVRLPNGLTFETTGPPLQIEYGPPFRTAVEFELGEVSLTFDRGVELPADGAVFVTLREAPDDAFPDHSLRIALTGGRIGDDAEPWVTRSREGGTDTFQVLGLPPGDWILGCHAVRKDAPSVKIDLGGGAFRHGPEEEFRVEGSVTVTAGSTSAVRVSSTGIEAR